MSKREHSQNFRVLCLCFFSSEFGQSLKKGEDVKQEFTTAHLDL